jgi:putative flavoprotein involved in K+ transport
MTNKNFDVIVVGAGFAGLSASYYLKKYGLEHIVFERGRIGESWRSQRWDAFRLNSTNKLNVLPGGEADNADGFWSAPEFVSSLDNYVTAHQLPVAEYSKVISIEKTGDLFDVTVLSNNGTEIYSGKQVLIASGVANEARIPAFAKNISSAIKQLHAGGYKNANELLPGAVLVAGGAQSGIQIAADLANAGRKVFFSTSKVARIPRWYRGRDIFYWLIDLKFFDVRVDEIEDPKLLEMRPPHISGTGSGKDTVSLQSLARKGVIILGKMENALSQQVFFLPDAAEHIKFADEYSNKVKELIDDHIEKNQLNAPPPHYDEADIPDDDAKSASSITTLDLKANNISSIIWCTGFNNDFSYIKLNAFDNSGKLKHKNGIPDIPGLYFLGYPWLFNRKSSIIFGIKDDAAFITDKIYACAKSTSPTLQSLPDGEIN